MIVGVRSRVGHPAAGVERDRQSQEAVLLTVDQASLDQLFEITSNLLIVDVDLALGAKRGGDLLRCGPTIAGEIDRGLDALEEVVRRFQAGPPVLHENADE